MNVDRILKFLIGETYNKKVDALWFAGAPETVYSQRFRPNFSCLKGWNVEFENVERRIAVFAEIETLMGVNFLRIRAGCFRIAKMIRSQK